jgi:ABC-type glutathione transport system ATPase component
MGYLESISWETIKKDLQEGLEKGVAAMKQGAIVMQKKAEELTEEGRRQYKVLTLKARIHEAITDLGAKAYVIMSSTKGKNPALDNGVKDIMVRIKDIEEQISILEGKGSVAPPKARPKARKKK